MLGYSDIVKYRDKLFVLVNRQLLFEYDENTKKTKLCGLIGNKWEHLFICMTLCEDRLYFAPYEADVISVYDIKNGEFYRISLEQKCEKMKRKYYHISFTYNKKVYFLGADNSVMLCLNYDDNKIVEIYNWMYEFEKKYNKKASVYTHKICTEGHNFWVALGEENLLMQYNMLSGEYQFWHVGKRRMQYATISYDGKYFWLSGYEKVIIRWKKETNEVKEFDNFPNDFKVGNTCGWRELFYCGLYWNNNIYFAPLNANMLIKFSLESEQIECIVKIENSNICCEITALCERYICLEEVDANNILKHLYLINTKDTCTECSVEYGNEEGINIKFAKENMRTEKGAIKELHPKFLRLFFSTISAKEVDNNSVQKGLGKSIYDYIYNN